MLVPALMHLVIEDLTHTWRPNTRINLPNLRLFLLRTFHDVEQLPGLLNVIAAPRLHTLLLEAVVYEEIRAFTDSRHPTLQTHKHPSVRSLAIFSATAGGQIARESWPNIFRAFPSVTQISLSCCEWEYFSKGAEEQLHLLSEIPIWPELDTLTLIDWRHTAPIRLRETITKSIVSVLREDSDLLRALVEVHSTQGILTSSAVLMMTELTALFVGFVRFLGSPGSQH